MSSVAIMMIAISLTVGSLAFLLWSLARSIRDQRSGDRSVFEQHLGTLPDDAPKDKGQSWQLPDTPLRLQDATS